MSDWTAEAAKRIRAEMENPNRPFPLITEERMKAIILECAGRATKPEIVPVPRYFQVTWGGGWGEGRRSTLISGAHIGAALDEWQRMYPDERAESIRMVV